MDKATQLLTIPFLYMLNAYCLVINIQKSDVHGKEKEKNEMLFDTSVCQLSGLSQTISHCEQKGGERTVNQIAVKKALVSPYNVF